MRILGLPSGREIHRIPCFVPDALVGWGITNESKKVMGTKPDGSLKYTVADTHHTTPRTKTATTTAATPGSTTRSTPHRAHPPGLLHLRQDHRAAQRAGLSTASSRTSATRWIPPSTTPRACSAAVSSPSRCPTTARTPTHPKSTARCSPAWTPKTMEVRWQVLIDGNCDLVATSYDGKLAPPTSTTPKAAPLRRHDVGRARRLPVLQHCPHRRSREGRQVQDLRRLQGARGRWHHAKPTRTPRRR
jgi:nitrous-oxide reductase